MNASKNKRIKLAAVSAADKFVAYTKRQLVLTTIITFAGIAALVLSRFLSDDPCLNDIGVQCTVASRPVETLYDIGLILALSGITLFVTVSLLSSIAYFMRSFSKRSKTKGK